MSIFQAIIIAIVEGLTEFLPISSTGHMVIASSIFGIQHEQFTKLFTVAIQLGAILAVVVLYWKKFVDFQSWQFYVKLLIAVIPALVFGKLFDDLIDEKLGNPAFIAWMFIAGGVILLFIDKVFRNPTIDSEKEIGYGKAFVIGLFQVLAVALPGISRSAATIIGGMTQKLTRRLAAEFSFFLAVPTMAAATGYSLFLKDWNKGGPELKGYELITQSQGNIIAFVVGNVVAFVVAMLAIRFFIGFLQKHGFRVFGWYRIVTGVILLLAIWKGWISQ
ncbi:MAG: undecaprenyl-diphosphate phosphatase [Chitinophagaceae bacterium]|nr:undecaprenyl-diphosphate phosphatase [Chitinophagaceae bacterium]